MEFRRNQSACCAGVSLANNAVPNREALSAWVELSKAFRRHRGDRRHLGRQSRHGRGVVGQRVSVWPEDPKGPRRRGPGGPATPRATRVRRGALGARVGNVAVNRSTPANLPEDLRHGRRGWRLRLESTVAEMSFRPSLGQYGRLCTGYVPRRLRIRSDTLTVWMLCCTHSRIAAGGRCWRL